MSNNSNNNNNNKRKTIVPLLQPLQINTKISSLLSDLDDSDEELQIEEDDDATSQATATTSTTTTTTTTTAATKVNANTNKTTAKKTPTKTSTTSTILTTRHEIVRTTTNQPELTSTSNSTTSIPTTSTDSTATPTTSTTSTGSPTTSATSTGSTSIPTTTTTTPETTNNNNENSVNNVNNNNNGNELPILSIESPRLGSSTTQQTQTTPSTPSTPQISSPPLTGVRRLNTPTLSHRGRKRKKDDAAVSDDTLDINIEIQRRKERAEYFDKNPQELLEAIRNVIFKFQQSTEFTFSTFKEIWKQEACLLEFFEIQPHQPELIHILYYGVIGYTLMNQPVNSKSAIVYLLYVLYTCQIIQPPIPIDITLNIWDGLMLYFNCFKLYRLAEPYHVFKILMDRGAFHFSASLHPVASLPIFKTNSTTVGATVIPVDLVGVNLLNGLINLDHLKDIHEQYNQAKKGNNPTVPISLNITKQDFYSDIYNLLEDNTVKKLENMLVNKIPGLP
ncbi:hypothetical protein PPL_01038 [Heterostelium album PN500]|uniref:Uncharacterized protein n=1 Tax=Heterostelium pallidum (strain ATCC 26659 / Pp 5 / PN500) TaxID=670386 RepID=D3AXY0_HETP5|nr:hypothetical protein PPL_01038 [Heterostelium album PN500]EFA85807.1 hypothetical protein PPL_01038 [Heterostelium album PN500]|eukprot:XP_020437913.1 hypothetical protein PPL_01038 [Heterostelium album PN500]